MSERIPVLAVRPEYAELITLYKDREVRHYPAPKKYIGQRIAIYASKTKPEKSNLDRINKIIFSSSFVRSYKKRITGEIKGAIVATAILSQSSPGGSKIQFQALQDCHFAPIEYFLEGVIYYWKLTDIIVLDDPLLFDFKSQVWSSIEAEKLMGWLD